MSRNRVKALTRTRLSAMCAPLLALLLALLPGLLPAHAASFDCTKARSKLNRIICADAALSALDSQAADAFKERVKSLSPAQYAHVRERHFLWRRQRGWFDDNTAAISEDYRRHLAWLTHPLLPLEGRYENDAGHAVRIETDAGAPDRISVQGEAAAPGPFAWVTATEGEAENRVVRNAEAATARPPLTLTGNAVQLTPVFLGAPIGPVQQCRIYLRFGSETLTLDTEGACGAALSGTYRRPIPAIPFWAVGRN